MTISLSVDSQAILLLASNVGLPIVKNMDLKPLSSSEWNAMSEKLSHSTLKYPRKFFEADPNEWKEQLDLNEAQVERMQRLLARGANLSMEIERLSSLGIWITTRAEPTYPQRLKKVLKRKCPVIMFGVGDYNLASAGGVAIVGSRDVDSAGVEFTAKLAQKCANEELVVISGGARGVDSIAQDTALNNGGRVLSILANGLEKIIQRREVRKNILENKMLLLTPFHPKVPFHAYNAMERNKFVYAMSNYTVVISAAEKKGGTWTGAAENLKAQWVPLFVRDEESCPSGNRTLIDQGAIPIDSAVLSSTKHLSEWFTQKLGEKAQRLDIHRKYMSNEEQNLKAMVNEQIALF
ncbi:DNA-processing protein DprA [Desulfosporosinus metallidurans]|uniref:Putative DNA processing chain A n=1 Tax=Desulfosporosinus metallidurans TaxID=1888891 RepID=A0A1Q8QYZ7_9FIRM|nr:DNA-processing protein DprA [Desulfosporosinus metallidurans]OLN32598.1 putative DNA processing chain A [Desulfosporosinus metallidurans]